MLLGKIILVGLVNFSSLLSGGVNATQPLGDRTIVVEMYIKNCEVCGYEKMEGYYSYVDFTGYEECKECGHYVEIDNN